MGRSRIIATRGWSRYLSCSSWETLQEEQTQQDGEHNHSTALPSYSAPTLASLRLILQLMLDFQRFAQVAVRLPGKLPVTQGHAKAMRILGWNFVLLTPLSCTKFLQGLGSRLACGFIPSFQFTADAQ